MWVGLYFYLAFLNASMCMKECFLRSFFFRFIFIFWFFVFIRSYWNYYFRSCWTWNWFTFLNIRTVDVIKDMGLLFIGNVTKPYIYIFCVHINIYLELVRSICYSLSLFIVTPLQCTQLDKWTDIEHFK